MMKRTYFLRVWPVVIRVTTCVAILLSVAYVIELGGYLLKVYGITAFKQLDVWLIGFANCLTVMCYGTAICLAINLASMILKHDTGDNFLRSVEETRALHRFLHQSEGTIGGATFGMQQVATVTRKTKLFNRTVKFSAVDIRSQKATVFILVPSSQQAQRVLKDIEEDLQEQLANRLHDFSFSQPIRKKNGLWIEGTRKHY